MMRELQRSITKRRREGQRVDLRKLATDLRLRRKGARLACDAAALDVRTDAQARLDAARERAAEGKQDCALADREQRAADRRALASRKGRAATPKAKAKAADKQASARRVKRAECEAPYVDRVARQREQLQEARAASGAERRVCMLTEQDKRAKDREALRQRMAEHEQTENVYRSNDIGERLRARADRAKPKLSASERRAQSDEEVERDIEAEDPSLVPVWHRVKKQIRATPRRSRSEAFFEWVHDSQAQVEAMKVEIQEQEFAREFEEWSRRAA